MNEFLDIVTKAVKREEKTKPYDTTAKVTRIDGDTVWVHIDGGVDETPVRKTIDASEGDIVQVRVGGGTAFLVGNATAPPTDDTTANYAYDVAMNARYASDMATESAYEARSQAELAYSLAGTAKRSADGKSTIYRGATQPSGGTYVAGDTWFDTSHDNKIYRYDGTSWVAVTLGDDAIGELNASHITAGEIDASQITVSNLDAGNVTTGLLDADYIDVNDVISKGSIIVTGSNISNLNNDSGFQNASQVSSAVSTGVSGKADKTDAVAKTQRIYYRSNSSTKPTAYPTAWVTEEGNKWNSNATTASGWSRKVTPISNGTGVNVQKFLYLWTATQKQMVNGTVATLTANDIALDDTTTVIDGGNIVTGTVTANKLNATDINASNSLTIGALSTSTQDDILNSNIDVGGRNLLKVNGSSTSKNTYRFADIPLTEPLVAGEEYTLQLWGISLDANSTGIGVYWGSGNNNLCTFARQNGHLTNTFTVTSAQASHADASNLTIYLYSYPSGRSDYNTSITKWKLEKGNKATDWSPAPEDIVNNNLLIDSQKMGSWQIGANASLDSSGEFGVATITGNTSWTGVIYSKPTISASTLDGSPLWLSFEYQYSEATAIAVALAGTSAAVDSTTSITRTKHLTKWPVLKSTNTWTKYSIQMPSTVAELTSDSGDVNSLYVQFFNYYTAGSTLKIRKVKLEHGIGSTDWTPSPQDQKAYITRIDDAGIRIHPASTENNSVVINASGMEVFKGGTASANSVAFYGDTARVGKESSRHVKITSSSISQKRDASSTYFTVSGGTGYSYLSFNPEYNPDTSTYGTAIEAYGSSTASHLYMDAYGKTEGVAVLRGNAYSTSGTSPALTCGQGGSWSSGKVQSTHTITVTSDRRLKEHISYLGDDAVEFARRLKPVHFKKDGENHVGFYAQDVEAVDKWHALVSDIDGVKALGYSELIAPLVAYCQHLEKRIEELERSNNGNNSN